MDSIEEILGKITRKTRGYFFGFLDDTAELSDRLQRDYQPPSWFPQESVPALARTLGDVSYMLGDFRGLPVWKLSGPVWTIIFSGPEKRLPDLQTLFFDKQFDVQAMGQVELRQLEGETRRWLNGEADLVICELSPIQPFRPGAPLTFSAPVWVDQVLDYPDSMEKLLAGNRRGRIRGRINKARKAGFGWRFSRTKADIELFHHRMYLPFLTARHGNRAMITNDAHHWDRWLSSKRGGVLLVTRNGQPMAGAVCNIANETCFNIDIGVLNSDEHLLQQGINAFLFWCVAEWGHRQGTRVYNMGGSRGWRTNGSFGWKAKWGARVVRQNRPSRRWTFLAPDVSPALQKRLNQIGFISELGGEFFRIIVDRDRGCFSRTEINSKVAEETSHGLAGVAVVSPNSRPVPFPWQTKTRQAFPK